MDENAKNHERGYDKKKWPFAFSDIRYTLLYQRGASGVTLYVCSVLNISASGEDTGSKNLISMSETNCI